jgi:hypothetical protein
MARPVYGAKEFINLVGSSRYLNSSIVDGVTTLGLMIADRCENQNNCIGMCACQAAFYKDGTSDIVKKVIWFSHNAAENVPFLGVSGVGTDGKDYAYKTYYTASSKGCNLLMGKSGGSQPEAILESSKRAGVEWMCQYQEPFCCCANKGGLLDDCRRSVTYQGSVSNLQPSCYAFPNGYKPFTSKAYPQYSATLQAGNNCQGFQDVVNKTQQNKYQKVQTTVGNVSSIDLRKEAATLNQTTFTSAQQVVGQLVKFLMSFIGSLALASNVVAGLLWMTAAGNAERVEQSKSILVWTNLGVLVMLASYFIVTFIFTTLNL